MTTFHHQDHYLVALNSNHDTEQDETLRIIKSMTKSVVMIVSDVLLDHQKNQTSAWIMSMEAQPIWSGEGTAPGLAELWTEQISPRHTRTLKWR